MKIDMELGTLGFEITDFNGNSSYGTLNMSVAQAMRHIEKNHTDSAYAITLYVEGMNDLIAVWQGGQWVAWFHRSKDNS